MEHMRKLCAFLLAPLMLAASVSQAEEPKLYSVPVKTIDGADTSLKPYAGKVLLLVNVASKCGYTSQYDGLEALWRKYRDKGLVVLGFPSNDFGSQEPGTNAEIKEFCSSKFDVSFPLFEKIHVKGDEQHPLYAALTGPQSPVAGPVKWNFTKFLVGRDGQVVKRLDSAVKPDSAELGAAVESALAAK
jgi:glutathione peroxidase